MTRVFVHVEGETEETFVMEALAERLYARGYEKVCARLVGKARLRSDRGGIKSWPAVRDDIVNHLRGDGGCLATTMIDYYALPATGARAWPGREAANHRPFALKAATVQEAIAMDVAEKMGVNFDVARFIPYVMMHEFEGLLFSDCAAFSEAVGQPELAEPLQDIRDLFNSPEEINDGADTCPSARILRLFPKYQKPLYGNVAALEIGIDAICEACPHFRAWVDKLESWLNQ